MHCEEFIDEFNGLHVSKDKRIKSGKQASTSKLLRDGRGPSVEKLSHRPSESGKSKGTSHKRKRINPALSKPKKGYSAKPPAGGDRAAKTVSYRTTPSGLQIMPLKKAQNGMENGDAGSEKDERHFGNGSHQPGLDLNDVGEQDLAECGVNHAAPAENGLGTWLVFVLCSLLAVVAGHFACSLGECLRPRLLARQSFPFRLARRESCGLGHRPTLVADACACVKAKPQTLPYYSNTPKAMVTPREPLFWRAAQSPHPPGPETRVPRGLASASLG